MLRHLAPTAWLMAAVFLCAPAVVVGEAGQRTPELEELATRLAEQEQRIARLQQRLAAAREQAEQAERIAALREQIRAVLGEEEFRAGLMPALLQAGYEKGFFIRSSDENFLLRFNGRIQFRWTHHDVGDRNRYLAPRRRRDDRTGFDVQRIRLKFTGHAFSPDLTYCVQLRTGVGSGYDTLLRDAYINYRLRDEFRLRFGMFKIAALQQQLTSDGKLQFVDRAMTEAVFQLSRGLGLRFWGRLFDRRLEYFVDVVNSFNGERNRTITNDINSPTGGELDGNPGLAFRLLWHALGDKPGKDLDAEADLEFHQSPALDFAFHYAFNDDAGDLRTMRLPLPLPRRTAGVGAFGLTSSNGMQLNQFGLAAAFKWQGFSARGEYILRLLDPRRAGRQPFTPWWLATGQADTTAMHGAYVQVGYFLPIPGLERKLEAAARVGGISTAANGVEGAWEYAGGLNYYLQGNNVKVQADVTKVTEAPLGSRSVSLANVNDRPLIFRVQLQLAF